MAETRSKFDQDFKEGAVRLVRETGRRIVRVARNLGINEGPRKLGDAERRLWMPRIVSWPLTCSSLLYEG